MNSRDFDSPYDYNPPKLRSRHGYTYGICPRQLHYACRDRKIATDNTQIKMMSQGSEKHDMIENVWKDVFPEFKKEHSYARNIKPILGIEQITCTADLVSTHSVIEIKPLYSIKAYYQTLIQKFVLPLKRFYVFSYIQYIQTKSIGKSLFPIMVDMNKVFEKVGKIITSLNIKPPRFPDANPYHKKCVDCLFIKECYMTNPMSYDRFQMLSQPAIQSLQSESVSSQ